MQRYRNAHWWLAALLPLIVLAFWPGYFGQMRSASIAHHVHGAAGMLWIALAAWQSWTIATRRWAQHRAAGQLVFVAVPLFVAGGTLAIIQGAAGFVAASDPFRAAFGARLTPVDIAAAVAVPLLVRDALIHRRRAARHAASMLATVLLILPPMIGRLLQRVPGLPPGFEPSFYAGELLGAAIAAWFWWRDRRDGGAFLAVALVDLAQCLCFGVWSGEAVARVVALLDPLPTAALAAGASALVLWSAWRPARRLAGTAAAG